MDRKMLRALALASVVTGAGLAATAGNAAAEPQKRWVCREDLPPGRAFDKDRCEYQQFPLRAPGALPNVNPQPSPSPGPTPPYST